jgi:DNA repair protein RecO (recombination protein O)
MIWTDLAIVLSCRKHGENSVIMSVLTKEHGRHLGLVRGGAGKRLSPLLQPGNLLRVEWKGRLDEHLGMFQVEMEQAYSAQALSNRTQLLYLNTFCAVCETCLAEKESVEGVFGATLILLNMLDQINLWPELYLRWELGLLNELGYGLDLTACAATGQKGDLIYVSPKTGRAVSRDAGEPYKNKLLPLPRYLLVDEIKPKKKDLIIGFKLTEHFLERCILTPNGKKLPAARTRFVDRLR